MSPRRIFATTRRVLAQLQNDKRTVALVMIVPIMLEVILWLIYYHNKSMFNRVGTPMLGIFPLVMMFVIASIATLRERTRGTLERLLAMPLSKGEFIAGYALAFSVIAIVQAVLVSSVTLWLLGLDVAGPKGLVLVVATLNGLIGMALGLWLSAYARTEFHAVQFMPAFILPQFLLCGLLVPRDDLLTALRWISDFLPLSYAVDVMKVVSTSPTVAGTDFARDIVIIVAFLIGGLILGAASIRRQSP